MKKILIFLFIFVGISLIGNVSAIVRYYNFTWNNSNQTAYYVAANGVNRLTLGTQATAAQYTALSSNDASYAQFKSTGSNFETVWRFNFTLNETKTSITWINASFKGYENASEVGTAYIYNFTSLAWVSMGTIGAGTNTVTTVNYTGANSQNFVSATTNGVVIAIEGLNFDLLDGDTIFADSASLRVGSTLEAIAPTYSLNQTNNTIVGLSTNFSILYNDNTALHPGGGYIFSTNNTGAWVNESFITFTVTPSWANVIKILNLTAGISIGYRWYANDTVGNNNNTAIFTLTTTNADTCTYSGSGNWIINCADNCAISSNVNVGGNNISITGTGTFSTIANITNWKKLTITGTTSTNRCIATCSNGGCFK